MCVVRWVKCQAVWAQLYTLLETSGEWLDGFERELDAAEDPQLPRDQFEDKLRDLEEQVC